MVVAASAALVQEVRVDIKQIAESGIGEKIGSVTIVDGKKGARFTVDVPAFSRRSWVPYTRRATAVLA